MRTAWRAHHHKSTACCRVASVGQASRQVPHLSQCAQPQPSSRAVWCCAKGDDEEPDWDKEMSIFNKRLSAPNQLATLRELEAKVNLGKVLYVKESLAVVTGLNADAPVGTKLSFVTGGTGVLLWHRSDNLAFVLILGGAAAIEEGTGVECKIKGVLQVIDDVKGPVTKKEFELFEVPAGEQLLGQVVNFLGLPLPAPTPASSSSSSSTHPSSSSSNSQQAGSSSASTPSSRAQVVAGLPGTSSSRVRPLLNAQVQIKQREQINEGLQTGVKALDLLTPLGKGACLLVVGPTDSGKSCVGEDAVLGQKGTGVACVYASTSHSMEAVRAMEGRLRAAGALDHTCIVASSDTAPLGEKYATLCAAFSIGEAIRDKGGHCLVVVDDMCPLSRLWDLLAIEGLGSLGRDMARQGLIKDSQGHDLNLPPPNSEEELVDYEGMLVSGAVAQRRGYFSTLFMRSARLAKSLGGGTLTSLLLVPGRPATGVTKKVDMSKYQTLSEEQKAKIKAVLERKLAEELAAPPPPGELSTEAVEEFISIADGQLVLEARPSPDAPYTANPKLSITRIGSRAFPRALELLGPQIRLQLAQAEDARKFNLEKSTDELTRKEDALSLRMAAALQQAPGQPAPLEEQVVVVLAVQRGYADVVAPEDMPAYLTKAFKFVQAAAPQALQEIRRTRMLTASAEKAITDALADLTTVIKSAAGVQ